MNAMSTPEDILGYKRRAWDRRIRSCAHHGSEIDKR